MKNRKLILGLGAGAGTALLSMLLFWLSGYDYDRRGPDVAFGAFIATVFSAGLGAMVAALQDD